MPQNKAKLDELLGQYWDIAHSEGRTGVSRGDEAGVVLSALQSLLDQPEAEPAAWQIKFKDEHGTQRSVTYTHNAIGDYRQIDPDAICEPLYTHPPAPLKMLDDDEFENVWIESSDPQQDEIVMSLFAEKIQQAFCEKNNLTLEKL